MTTADKVTYTDDSDGSNVVAVIDVSEVPEDTKYSWDLDDKR